MGRLGVIGGGRGVITAGGGDSRAGELTAGPHQGGAHGLHEAAGAQGAQGGHGLQGTQGRKGCMLGRARGKVPGGTHSPSPCKSPKPLRLALSSLSSVQVVLFVFAANSTKQLYTKPSDVQTQHVTTVWKKGYSRCSETPTEDSPDSGVCWRGISWLRPGQHLCIVVIAVQKATYEDLPRLLHRYFSRPTRCPLAWRDHQRVDYVVSCAAGVLSVGFLGIIGSAQGPGWLKRRKRERSLRVPLNPFLRGFTDAPKGRTI